MTTNAELSMAKVNKSMLLNEGLIRLIDSIQKKTGVSFTRVMTAAVLQYLFNDPDGPNQLWMEYAVALENGEISVGDMPKERQEDLEANAHSRIRHPGGTTMIEIEENLIPEELRKTWIAWRNMHNANAEDTVQNIIDYWN